MADPKFTDKSKRLLTTTVTPPAVTPEPTPNTATGLSATDIVTGVQNLSALVQVGSNQLQTIVLTNLNSWAVSGRDLIIQSDDPVPIVLSFTSNSEAVVGESRLSQIANGNII